MKTIMVRGLALLLALLMGLGMTTAFASGKTVAINKTNFPDSTFRAYVKENCDKNQDGKLSASEIAKVFHFELYGQSAIKNLKGIEHFTALTDLVICGTSVQSLDLRKNTKLELLDASSTPMKALKITGLKKLNWVDVAGTKLKKLDISGCTMLLSAISYPYKFENDSVVGWGLFWISTTTKLMKGSKVLRQYAKPKSISFSKKSLTIKKGKGEDLISLLSLNPSTRFYPVTFTCNKAGILDMSTEEGRYVYGMKKGTVTVTAKCGSAKATIKITVK